MSKYAKAIAAILGAVLTAVLTQFPDSDVVQQWGPIVSALLTAVTVYLVPNTPADAPKPGDGGSVDLVVIYYVLGIVFFTVATLWLLGVGTRGVF